jgi:dipeptidase E
LQKEEQGARRVGLQLIANVRRQSHGIVNIYASSYRLCAQPTRLRDLFAESKRIAVISNALDFSSDHDRRNGRVTEEIEELAELGLKPKPIDLREFFGSPDATRRMLEGFDGVWVLGGNVFILRRAMKYSGFDQLLSEKASASKTFVYAGYSAGACVLGPTLKGIHLVDAPEQSADGYDAEVIWEGINLLPFSIAPHFDSDHPESLQINDVVRYFEAHEIPYRKLRDGEAIVVHS